MKILDGVESTQIKKHKLRFWLLGWRLYKVWSRRTNQVFYIITNQKLPKFKYESYITGNMKRLTDFLFLWRVK